VLKAKTLMTWRRAESQPFAEVKTALRSSLVPANAPDSLFDAVLQGAIIPRKFWRFIESRGVCVLSGQKARALVRLLPDSGTFAFSDLFGAFGAPRTGMLSSLMSRDPSTRRYYGTMLSSKAEYIIVNHVTNAELDTALSTIHAVHKQMRHCVGFILCLDGSAPPGVDYGLDVISDADFGEAHRVVAASARPVAPPEILRAAAFINQPMLHEVRVSTLAHMREMQRRAGIGSYA